MIYVSLIVAFIAAIILTPLVKRLAFRLGAVDAPNYRKVHARIMPRLGGLAIFGAFMIGILLLKFVTNFESDYLYAILIAATIIVATGIVDDMREISAKAKLLGQVIAACIVVFVGGIQIDNINLPFGGELEFGWLGIPFTIIWIVGITNAINLIDGLDGLGCWCIHNCFNDIGCNGNDHGEWHCYRNGCNFGGCNNRIPVFQLPPRENFHGGHRCTVFRIYDFGARTTRI